ncbi:hypothetical protein MANI_002833 [Metarhizium anisopliae]
MGLGHFSLTNLGSMLLLAATLVPTIHATPTRIHQNRQLQPTVVFADGFEGPAPTFGFTRSNIETVGSIKAVTNPVLEGQHSAEFTVANDGNSWRAEVAKNSLGFGSFSFSFANYLPTNWVDTPVNTIIAQWHGSKLTNGKNTNPPIALSVKDNYWQLKVHYLENPTDAKPKSQTYKLPQIVKGVWNQWDFRINWSGPENQGTLVVTLNGETVAEHHGPNNYHQKQAPYFKQGIYRPNWNPAKGHKYATGGPPVIVYCDNIIVTQFKE